MSTVAEQESQRRSQKLGQEVQRRVRDVITEAAVTVQRLKPQDSLPSGMRESQLRNVVNAALSAQSVEEVAAFILYQMGRSTNRRQWLYGNFGDKVVADLMRGVVHEKATEVVTALGSLSDENSYRQAHLDLARQYLGYLNRLFYFVDKSNRWSDVALLTKAEQDKQLSESGGST